MSAYEPDYIDQRQLENELASALEKLAASEKEVAELKRANEWRPVKTFTMYRRDVPDTTHNANQKNAPDDPQFEGAVFSDGRVAIRWLTAKRSVAVWDCLEDMLAIHEHPEYGSELIWHGAPPPRSET